MYSASVIIPCHNNAATIEAAVGSVLKQTAENIEIIVVDDGSTDKSRDIVSEYGAQVTLISQEKSGACVARNRGLHASSAPLVKFLDADDVLLPDCIYSQLAQAQSQDDQTVVFGKGIWVDETGRSFRTYPDTLQHGDTLNLVDLIEGSPLTSCPLHRRDHLLRVGGFDPECLRGQEHDLHIRLGVIGVRFRYFETDCYHYIQHRSDERISQRRHNIDVLNSQFETYTRQWQILNDTSVKMGQDAEIQSAFARHFWRLGRISAASGHSAVASRCFSASNDILNGRAKGAVGSIGYRVLAKTFGGLAAERFIRKVKQLTNLGAG